MRIHHRGDVVKGLERLSLNLHANGLRAARHARDFMEIIPQARLLSGSFVNFYLIAEPVVREAAGKFPIR